MAGKKGKGKKRKPTESIKRPLEVKAEGQEYAKITKLLGNCRMSAVFPDGKTTLVHIPGKFRRKCFVTAGDIIIVCIRSFQDGKTDMAYVYKQDEVRQLRTVGEIPPFFMERGAIEERGSDDEIEWSKDDLPPPQRESRTGFSDISSNEESEDVDDV